MCTSCPLHRGKTSSHANNVGTPNDLSTNIWAQLQIFRQHYRHSSPCSKEELHLESPVGAGQPVLCQALVSTTQAPEFSCQEWCKKCNLSSVAWPYTLDRCNFATAHPGKQQSLLLEGRCACGTSTALKCAHTRQKSKSFSPYKTPTPSSGESWRTQSIQELFK